MKKILSILVALVVLTTSVTLFAEATASSKNYFNVYLDEVKLANGAIESATPYRIPGSSKAALTVNNEKITVQRTEEGIPGSLLYDYSATSEYGFNYYSFGASFTVDGFTGHSDETKVNVFTTNPGVQTATFPDRVVSIVDGVGYDANGNVVSKTVNVFAKTGNNANCAVKVLRGEDGEAMVDENDKVLLQVGDVTLKQGTEYKLTYYVDKVAGTYSATVSSADMAETVVADGLVQNAFTGVAKTEFSIANTTNLETKVTFDNFFVNNLTPFQFGSALPVSSNGTVTYGAYIAEEIENPAIYINGIKAEDITPQAGVTSYEFTTQIPDGITFGDAKFELKGTVGGNEVCYEKTTTLVKNSRKELTSSPNKTLDATENAYIIQETNFNYDANYQVGGIYEFHFDFKTDALKQIDVRISPNGRGSQAGIEGGTIGNFAVFKNNGNDSNYGAWTAAQLTAAGVTLKTDDYNTAVLRMDYTGNAMENYCPYTLTVNGVVAVDDVFKLSTNATINGFTQVKINIKKESTATFGYFKYSGYEIVGAPEAESVIAYYEDGTNENGTAGVVSGLFMDNIKVNLSQELSNTEGNISFVNAAGAQMGEVSVEGALATIKINEDILPSGTYKLVIGKNAVALGSALGLDVVVPIEISSNDQVLAPKLGSIIEGEKVTLSAFAKDASKVEFYLNDEKVSGVTNGGSGNIYTATATIEENGLCYFDVYAYGEEGLTVTSSSFRAILPGGKHVVNSLIGSLTTTKDGFSILQGGKTLATGRVAITGTITLPDTTTKAYFDLGTNSSNTLATTTATGWGRISDAFGFGVNENICLFNDNGTIGASSAAYQANVPYNFRYVIDFDKDVFEFWVDGVKYAEYQSQNTSDTRELCDLDILYFRFQHKGGVGVVYEDVSVHTEAISPVISDIEIGGASASVNGLYIAPVGAESIVIKLDKAYEEDNLDGKVLVKVDDVVSECSAVYNKEAKTVTLSGISYKAGQKIEIVISGTAKVLVDTVTGTDGSAAVFGTAATETGKDLKITMFTGDSNKVCILPLKLETENGTDILAYSRFINGSGSDVDTFLIITEYEDPETQTRVINTKFAPIEMKAGKSGAVSGYLNGVTSAQGCKVMLWNTDFAPLVSDEMIANN